MTFVPNTPEAWSARAREGNASWEAAGWSAAGQSERFMAVLRTLRYLPGETLLDFGCGTGAFAAWLPPSIEWFGWDWAEGMRARARDELCMRDNCTVLEHDPLDRETEVATFHHVVAIGPFNLADGWSRDRTWDTVRALWEIADRSLIVSLYRGTDPDTMSYDPVELLEAIERCGPRRWRIDATYRDNDMLLVMRRR